MRARLGKIAREATLWPEVRFSGDPNRGVILIVVKPINTIIKIKATHGKRYIIVSIRIDTG